MILLPFLFGFIFILLLLYKVLGGGLDWVYVIISGALFILPLLYFIFAWWRYNAKLKKAKHVSK
tara:strand:+ start:808 stop:999 length:192 start_codon:yes stop_codon:yes gene_type:complete